MSNNHCGEYQQSNFQDLLLKNLNFYGNLTVEDATQNIYFTPPPPELTLNGMRHYFYEVRAIAGVRYTPEIHVNLPKAWVVEGLGINDIFLTR
ncbi:MAG: hypothetical protein ACYTXE_36950 [Nostoc sp.]